MTRTRITLTATEIAELLKIFDATSPQMIYANESLSERELRKRISALGSGISKLRDMLDVRLADKKLKRNRAGQPS